MKPRVILVILAVLFALLVCVTGRIEYAIQAFLGIVIIGALTYFLVRYFIPWLWQSVIKPLGKLAWFLLLITLAVAFTLIMTVGAELRVPPEIRILVAFGSAIVGGYKWARNPRV